MTKDEKNFFAACERNDLALLKTTQKKGLFSKPVNPDSFDGKMSGLCIACKKGYEEIIKFLIEKGANVNLASDGRAPIFYAVKSRSLDTVRLLIEAGADKNALTEEGHSPLMEAVIGEDLKMCEYLISIGSDVNHVDEDKRSALMLAAEYCRGEIVEILLNHGSKINQVDNMGYTALLLVSDNPFDGSTIDAYSIARQLVDKGADVNRKSKAGDNALYLAAKNNNSYVASVVYPKTKIDCKKLPLYSASSVMCFLENQEKNFQDYIKYADTLLGYGGDRIPLLYALKRIDERGSYPFLIVLNIESRFHDMTPVYRERMEKAFSECFPDRNIETDLPSIHGKVSFSNWAPTGYEISDTVMFDKLMSEIAKEYYEIIKTIFTKY